MMAGNRIEMQFKLDFLGMSKNDVKFHKKLFKYQRHHRFARYSQMIDKLLYEAKPIDSPNQSERAWLVMIANGTCSHRAITDIKAAGIPHNRFVIILHRVQRFMKYSIGECINDSKRKKERNAKCILDLLALNLFDAKPNTIMNNNKFENARISVIRAKINSCLLLPLGTQPGHES